MVVEADAIIPPGHCDRWQRASRPETPVVAPNIIFHRWYSGRASASCRRSMEGVWNIRLNPARLVFAVEFGIAVVVTDQSAASQAIDLERRKMISRGIMPKVAGRAFAVAGAEHLVVAIDDSTFVTDDIAAIVGLVGSGQGVRRSDDRPNPQFARQRHHGMRRVFESAPIECVKGADIDAGIAGQACFGKMSDIGAARFRRWRIRSQIKSQIQTRSSRRNRNCRSPRRASWIRAPIRLSPPVGRFPRSFFVPSSGSSQACGARRAPSPPRRSRSPAPAGRPRRPD